MMSLKEETSGDTETEGTFGRNREVEAELAICNFNLSLSFPWGVGKKGAIE